MLITFEWKIPRITAEEMIYGEYLRKHPDILPQEGVDLTTEGYLISAVDYGEPDNTKLPFAVGDWVEKDYVRKNFRETAR